MKIPIETKEEKDQPEEKEAWMEKLHHNAAIMSACRNFFPEGPECVWCALFKSIVPSISQGNAGKLFELGLDLFRKADKSIESIDNRIMFEGVEPPGPPPPVVGSAPGPTDNCMFCKSGSLLQTVFLSDGEDGYRNEAYICMKCLRKLVLKEPCPMGFSKSLFGYPPSPKPPVSKPAARNVGTVATLLYENKTTLSVKIRVSNNDILQPMWIGTEDVGRSTGIIIPKMENKITVVPAGRSLWGISSAETVNAQVNVLEYLKELDSTSDDSPACCLCGSGFSQRLLQPVFLSKRITTPPGDVYYTPSTGEAVSLSESYICMECLRGLIEEKRRNVG